MTYDKKSSNDESRFDDLFESLRKDGHYYWGGVAQSVRAMLGEGQRHSYESEMTKLLEPYAPEATTSKGRILIPLAAGAFNKRNLDAATGSIGGYLVGNTVSDQVILSLRDKSAFLGQGARVLLGLNSNLTYGKELTPSVWSWYGRGESVSVSDGTYGQIALVPKRGATLTGASRQLFRQTAPIDLQAHLYESAMLGAGILVDAGIINGSGQKDPLGILNSPGVQTITFGATPTWAKCINFQRLSLDQKSRVENLRYYMSPATREKLQNVQKFTGATDPILKGEAIDTVPCLTTTSMTNQLLLGDPTTLTVGFWGPGVIELIVDEFSSKKTEIVELQFTLYCDCMCEQTNIWVKSTDSAQQ